MRVMPGRLSVSRTFGDCIAKMEKYGGNPRCVIAEPEIFTVKIMDDLDYTLIGSDGIFDRISTTETCSIVINEAQRQTESMKTSPSLTAGSFEHIASTCGEAVDRVLMAAMERESMDNLSVVLITFPNFTQFLESIEPQQGKVSTAQRNRTSQQENNASHLPPAVPARTDQTGVSLGSDKNN